MNKPLITYFRIPWSLIWRGLLGLILAGLTLFDLGTQTFDSRLRLGPKQEFSTEVVLVHISPFETRKWQQGRNFLGASSAVLDASDEFFWDESFWHDLLKKTLAANPKKIGVSLFFSDINTQPQHKKIFENPKIIWAAPKRVESYQLPHFALYDLSNIGELNFNEDSDGIFRRYHPSRSEVGDFFVKVLGKPLSGTHLRFSRSEKEIPMLDASSILNGSRESLHELSGKIVIFGRSTSDSNFSVLTPLGPLSKLGMVGSIVNNDLTNSWIRVFPASLYVIFFTLLGLFIIWLISSYPHKVALILLVFFGVLLTLVSIYLFDVLNTWTPIIGIWVQITTTWVLFLGYSLNEMEQKTNKLREERKLNKELDELKINFVSLISHDLKTPIAKIQAVTSRLLHSDVSKELAEDLQKIEIYSQDLNRYIQNVLKLLQAESSAFQISVDSVDINQLIEEAILELQPLAAAKAIKVETDLSPLFPIDADHQLIKEVLINLVQNAIQYSSNKQSIQVSSEEEGSFVKIKVTDSGRGIPSEEIPFLFEKFYRGKNSSLSQQGSGLGLFLVKYFIEMHSGRIHVQSEINKGTQFTIWLPIEQESQMSSEEENFDEL